MIIAIVTLSILLMLVAYLAYINYIKYQKALEYAESVASYSDLCTQFISKLWFKFNETKTTMDLIDRNGAFKADDQVGHTFTAIKESVDDLYNFITKYVDRKDEKKESKKD